MKDYRLVILRHAKSSWDDETLADRDRPLNRRGRQAAPRLGAMLADVQWIPDVVLCSTAERTRQTWQLVSEELPKIDDVRMLDELYLPSLETLLAVLRTVQDEHATVLMVGHNPGCELLAHRLLGEPVGFKTAEAALLSTQADDWYSAVGQGHLWKLEHQLSPREEN